MTDSAGAERFELSYPGALGTRRTPLFAGVPMLLVLQSCVGMDCPDRSERSDAISSLAAPSRQARATPLLSVDASA
jgi:hypothetical protein